MLANSIFRDDEYLQQPERGGQGATRDSFREQVLAGVKVGEHHYVRLFPVWFEFRGNNGTMLASDKGISAAAHLRGSLEMAELAERNLQWVVGRNPFVQSLMWGEGYDFAPQYTAMSGDIVGSLPVGIQSHRNADKPYWPTENCHNWKEVWVHPVGRWIWLLRDLAGPAKVSGNASGPVSFRELRSGKTVTANGAFHVALSEGTYEVTAGAQRQTLTVLPGASYTIDLSAEKGLEWKATAETSADGEITVKVTLSGSGRHSIALRTDNLALDHSDRRLTLKAGEPQTATFKTKLVSKDAPWIAVVIPDANLSARRELIGIATPYGN
jgi:hypothetical protein